VVRNHAKTNVCVLLIVIRKGEYDMGYYKSLLTDQQEELRLAQVDAEYDEAVANELEQALADGDVERASQLASLIDITIQ
tara:strand:- start:4253 stop:4492 length:240 start_codon:yes stop_codon:yes gene_type:complete